MVRNKLSFWCHFPLVSSLAAQMNHHVWAAVPLLCIRDSHLHAIEMFRVYTDGYHCDGSPAKSLRRK